MNHRRNRMGAYLAFVAIAVASALGTVSAAAPGVADDAIVFGQSACFSGINAQLGTRFHAGIQAAFREQNRQGGVAGRTLKIIALDDGYEPTAAAENAERFAAGDEVFAVIGGVGTPTAKRVAPILRDARVPFVGLFTGAGFLRDLEKFPNVVHLRASYLDEIELLVGYMVDKLGSRRFGVIYQDDVFGRSVLHEFHAVLDRYDLPILARSAFSRNTHAVHSSLFTLGKADLDAVLIVGSYPANADVIRLAHSLGSEFVMANLSFVASHDLLEVVGELDEEAYKRVLVSEVVPDPKDRDSKVVGRFLRAVEEAGDLYTLNEGLLGLRRVHFTDAVSLEGYILGRFVINVLSRLEGEPTRGTFLAAALQPEAVYVDDWKIQIDPGTNTGSTYVRLTNLAGENLEHGEHR